MEVAVMKRLQRTTPHVCDFLACGRNDKVNYVVMTLLGPSLSELRKRQHHQRFTHSTVLRVGIQIISAIRAIHNCGFLHRDIKPSNFAIGATPETSRTCYMLDFGLSRQYTTLTGEVRQPRAIAGFRGTVRYASLNAHLAHDLGRHDDLWSVFYMLVELAVGQLPWRRIRDKEEAGDVKAQYDHGRLIKTMPFEFYTFLGHLKDLTYFQKPDYTMLINLLHSSMKRLGIHDSDLYDWEQDYSAPSLTTASAVSPPAVKINDKNQLLINGGVNGKQDAASSKTNCSEVADLSNNGHDTPPAQARQECDARASDGTNMKGSPIKSSEGGGKMSIPRGNNSPSCHRDQSDPLAGENIGQEAEADNPVQPAKVEEEEDDGGLGKLGIENRYESEGETSSTDSSSESEKNQNEKSPMETTSNNCQRPQPNIPLQLMDGDYEPLHRYGSITPMKSIHTDSLNRFFDMGPHQSKGSSETMGNRFPHSQSRELEADDHSDQQESQTTTSTSETKSRSSHPSHQEREHAAVIVHPELGHEPREGYSSESIAQSVEGIDKKVEDHQPPAHVVMFSGHAASSSMDRETELQPPRVLGLSNGLRDSDSSRSVQLAAVAITVKETTDVVHVLPKEQCHLPSPPSAPLKPPENHENGHSTQTILKHTNAQTPPKNTTAISPTKMALATGGGRKLPAIPGSKTNSMSTLTSKASPLPSSSPLSHPPSTPHSLNQSNMAVKQEVQVLPDPSIIPHPPPNPPPANYAANILARRRRFIRSQPK